MKPTLPMPLPPPRHAEAREVRRQLRAALRAWERQMPPVPDGTPVGLDVKRVTLGARKGYAVRIVFAEWGKGGPIVAEWKQRTQGESEACYLLRDAGARQPAGVRRHRRLLE